MKIDYEVYSAGAYSAGQIADPSVQAAVKRSHRVLGADVIKKEIVVLYDEPEFPQPRSNIVFKFTNDREFESLRASVRSIKDACNPGRAE